MVTNDTDGLLRELKRAGLSEPAIRAAWPSWWTEEMSSSTSARTELRFALARKLGLAPKPLLGERVEFVWKDKARFKHLSTESPSDLSVMSSFAFAAGRIIAGHTSTGNRLRGIPAEELRQSILKSSQFVDLQSLVSTCWALGVAVVHLRVFPLSTKSMHAMVVEEGDAGVVMLGRDASYPAPTAFTLAHEMGHLALGHLRNDAVLVDIEDPAHAQQNDDEEREADRFALTLLTGSADPDIVPSVQDYNAPTLASAVLKAGFLYRIEPGTLALCVGYREKNWPVVMSALSFVYAEKMQVWRFINRVAETQMDWSGSRDDENEFLQKLLDLKDA